MHEVLLRRLCSRACAVANREEIETDEATAHRLQDGAPANQPEEPTEDELPEAPHTGWVSMLLFESLRKQCDHPAQRQRKTDEVAAQSRRLI